MNPQRLFRLSPEPPKVLTFAPLAWLKLQLFCHAGDTEVGGFGLSAEKDLLYIEDFVTVRQQATSVTVRFDDAAVADWFDRCVDQGLAPSRFARVWLHTHPGASVTPSGMDEETFARVFGRCDWSVMFILGRTAQTYARLAFSAGPGGCLHLPVQVDWSIWPDVLSGKPGSLETQIEQWRLEYAAKIQVLPELALSGPPVSLDEQFWVADWWDLAPWSPELDEVFFSLAEKDNTHDPRI